MFGLSIAPTQSDEKYPKRNKDKCQDSEPDDDCLTEIGCQPVRETRLGVLIRGGCWSLLQVCQVLERIVAAGSRLTAVDQPFIALRARDAIGLLTTLNRRPRIS